MAHYKKAGLPSSPSARQWMKVGLEYYAEMTQVE